MDFDIKTALLRCCVCDITGEERERHDACFSKDIYKESVRASRLCGYLSHYACIFCRKVYPHPVAIRPASFMTFRHLKRNLYY